MRNYYIFLILFVAVLSAGTKKVGEVDFRMGMLSVKHNGSCALEELDEEDSVFEMDTLITDAESKCEIILNDGSTLRLNEQTDYVIEHFSTKNGDVTFKGNLLKGETWTDVNNSDGGKNDFKVRSPIAVAAVLGTAYKMTSDGSLTEISVLDGKVDVDLEETKKKELDIKPEKSTGSLAPRQKSGPKQIPGPFEVTLSEWITVVKGEKISIRNDGKYNKEKTEVGSLIREWDAFKAKR